MAIEMLMALPGLAKAGEALAGLGSAAAKQAGGIALHELLGAPIRNILSGPGQGPPPVGLGQIQAQGAGSLRSGLSAGLGGGDPRLQALLAMLTQRRGLL